MVWTDVVQAIIMVLSVTLVALAGIQKVGGIGEVWRMGVEGGRIAPIEWAWNKIDKYV